MKGTLDSFYVETTMIGGLLEVVCILRKKKNEKKSFGWDVVGMFEIRKEESRENLCNQVVIKEQK